MALSGGRGAFKLTPDELAALKASRFSISHEQSGFDERRQTSAERNHNGV